MSSKHPEDHLHARLLFSTGREPHLRRSSGLASRNQSSEYKSEPGAVINVAQLRVKKKSDCFISLTASNL